jgi:isoleucyl-tRNA synthetase
VLNAASLQVRIDRAPGTKCVRCWRVLEEVGTVAAHPSLCLRCADAVEALACTAA